MAVSVALLVLLAIQNFAHPKLRILFYTILGTSVFYLSINIAKYLSASANITIQEKYNPTYLSILTFVFISIGAFVSPSSGELSYPVYLSFIGLSAGTISLQIFLKKDYSGVILLQIVLLAVLVRGGFFFQFPTIPGKDTVSSHVHIILEILSSGYSIQGFGHYNWFQMSHIRVALTKLITSLSIKNSAYYGLYLIQALSLVFVFLFIKNLFKVGKEGNFPALIGTLFVAVSSFHIPSGVRLLPQTTAITLLPLLLFLLLKRDIRFKSLAFLVFLVITLSHHTFPWIIIIVLFLLMLIQAASKALINGRIRQRLYVSINHIFYTLIIFFVIRYAHVIVTDFHKVLNKMVYYFWPSLLTAKPGQGVDLVSAGPNALSHAFLRFASSYLVLAAILLYTFYILIDKIQNSDIELFELGLFLSVSLMWTIVGLGLLFGNPTGLTRVGGALLIITLPIVYLVFYDIQEIGNLRIYLPVIFMLFLTFSVVGVMHPRSNVDDVNRPGRIALTTQEVAGYKFASSYISETIRTDIKASQFRYITTPDLSMCISKGLGWPERHPAVCGEGVRYHFYRKKYGIKPNIYDNLFYTSGSKGGIKGLLDDKM